MVAPPSTSAEEIIEWSGFQPDADLSGWNPDLRDWLGHHQTIPSDLSISSTGALPWPQKRRVGMVPDAPPPNEMIVA